MRNTLKECPFCGNDGSGPVEDALHVALSEHVWRDPSWHVQCDRCTATMGYFDTVAGAIAAWNSRKSPRTDMGDAFDTPTDDLTFILGQPCFKFIRHAQIWRAAGHKLPTRAEDEQAFFIGRMLHHYFTAPDKWHDTWADEIEAVQTAALTALRTGEATDV